MKSNTIKLYQKQNADNRVWWEEHDGCADDEWVADSATFELPEGFAASNDVCFAIVGPDGMGQDVMGREVPCVMDGATMVELHRIG